MSSIQIITSPSGEELVVLTRAEYDAMLAALEASEAEEDAELIAIADARMADAAGSAPLPPAVTRLMLDGASLLKALRKWRRVGQVALGEAIGVSQGYISDLESGRRGVTNDLKERLAIALDVPLDWLMAGVEGESE